MDGRNLSQDLVRAGTAWWYRQYARRGARLNSIEKQVHRASVGALDARRSGPTVEMAETKKLQMKARALVFEERGVLMTASVPPARR